MQINKGEVCCDIRQDTIGREGMGGLRSRLNSQTVMTFKGDSNWPSVFATSASLGVQTSCLTLVSTHGKDRQLPGWHVFFIQITPTLTTYLLLNQATYVHLHGFSKLFVPNTNNRVKMAGA